MTFGSQFVDGETEAQKYEATYSWRPQPGQNPHTDPKVCRRHRHLWPSCGNRLGLPLGRGVYMCGFLEFSLLS